MLRLKRTNLISISRIFACIESGPIGRFSYHICTSRKLNHAQLASRILRTNRNSKMMTYVIRKASDRTTFNARKEERVVRTNTCREVRIVNKLFARVQRNEKIDVKNYLLIKDRICFEYLRQNKNMTTCKTNVSEYDEHVLAIENSLPDESITGEYMNVKAFNMASFVD